jgi:hypothetical protein
MTVCGCRRAGVDATHIVDHTSWKKGLIVYLLRPKHQQSTFGRRKTKLPGLDCTRIQGEANWLWIKYKSKRLPVPRIFLCWAKLFGGKFKEWTTLNSGEWSL